ncbi:hypothetical protein KCU67_g96, partial [Aureobasidium melanogenum]
MPLQTCGHQQSVANHDQCIAPSRATTSFPFGFLFWRRRLPRTLTAVTDIAGYKLVITLVLTWPCSAI